MIIAFIILAVLMYFGMMRPQKKQQQKRMQMMDQMKKGDRVVLVDGLHGKIDSINDKDKTVVIDADGIYLTFSRLAIRQVLPAKATETEAEKPAEEAKPTEPEASAEATEPATTEPEANKNEDSDK